MICALLIFQAPELPAPLAELSPWLDWLPVPRDQVFRQLEAQRHRRFIKTHTPLDGLPLDPRATYIVVARSPLDMALSLYYQGANIDRTRLRQLTGQPEPTPAGSPRLPPREWLLRWIDDDVAPQQQLDSLRGVLWHLDGAWSRRDGGNVVLLHYDSLLADLDGGMRELASTLGIEVPDQLWPELVKAATFDHMRASAPRLVPDPLGIFHDSTALFRQGQSGCGRALLSEQEHARYLARTRQLARADLLAWLHREDPSPVSARE